MSRETALARPHARPRWAVRLIADGHVVEHEVSKDLFNRICANLEGFDRCLNEKFVEAVCANLDHSLFGDSLDSAAAPRTIDTQPLETPNLGHTDHSEVSP